MSQYLKTIFKELIIILVLIIASFVNFKFPLYLWFGDTPIIRFLWLGIFFVILDIFFEVLSGIMRQFRLIAEKMSLSRDIKKISDGFKVATNVSLSSNLKADFVVIGSSGTWLIMVQNSGGKIEFDGDEIIQSGAILKGLLTKTLERGYSLAGDLKQKLNRNITVTPVISFSSLQADLSSVPKNVRGVNLVSRKDTVALIENTDVQILDKNTIEEIYKILKK